MRPRHYDRFVLIGLCWLYGRSEFPPPSQLLHLILATGDSGDAAKSCAPKCVKYVTLLESKIWSACMEDEEEIHYVHTANNGL